MARTDRISVRTEKNLRQKINKWAAREDVTRAEMYRRLLEWAAEQYERVGELAALRKSAVSSKKTKTG